MCSKKKLNCGKKDKSNSKISPAYCLTCVSKIHIQHTPLVVKSRGAKLFLYSNRFFLQLMSFDIVKLTKCVILYKNGF